MSDPADVVDADAYEDLIHNNLATIDSEPDQTAIGEAPELTEQEDPSAIGDHSDLTSPQGIPTVIVDQFHREKCLGLTRDKPSLARDIPIISVIK